MCPASGRAHSAVRARQRGQAALITVLLVLGAGAAAFVYALATPARITIESDKKTAAARAQAKEALIGYAARNPNQPGILPCPDSDNDGSADSPCGATGVTAVGRLPWKTLGLPDLRDGSGECLWYAVSANFKNSGTSGPSTLNSDSAGTLVINDTGGTPVYSGSNAVLAIVFAPGGTLSGQDRSPGSTTVCGGNTTVANYLEGGNQNGAATDTFVSGQATTAFNDRLLAITSDALFSVVAVRVAKEARTALDNYRGANGYYPAANPYTSGGPAYYCDPSTYEGRIPITIKNIPPPPALPAGCLSQADWAGLLPSWFTSNNWNLVTHYAVSEACTVLGVSASTLCDLLGGDDGSLGLSPPLTVTGITTNGRMLVIVTGRALSSQVHPCSSAAQCLEDEANYDNDLARVYAKPSRFPASNDRMALTCGSSSPCSAVP